MGSRYGSAKSRARAWGGSAIKHDIVAACGLFLEFGNWVITTRIQKIRVIRREASEAVC